MNSLSHRPAWRPRFTLRSILTVMLLLALLLGWRTSAQRAERRLAEQQAHLEYAERELARARDEAQDLQKPQRDRSRALYGAELEGASMPGVTLASHDSAFQRTSFKGCNLQDATLQGDTAAFQLARFDGAQLRGAKLVGGHAAFQGATFVEADLSGATLTGGYSSFQTSSFENATLVGARLKGSFQGVNLSGARFQGADLSAIRAEDLAGCYFRHPPSYDAQTKFPAEFDPQAKLWRRVEN